MGLSGNCIQKEQFKVPSKISSTPLLLSECGLDDPPTSFWHFIAFSTSVSEISD
jgi:hypothetical protein